MGIGKAGNDRFSHQRHAPLPLPSVYAPHAESSQFHWDEQANEYRCPEGHALRSDWRPFAKPRTHITKAHTIVYRSSQFDCAPCPLKARCCPRTPIRKIVRSIHENARDMARRIAKTLLTQDPWQVGNVHRWRSSANKPAQTASA